MTAEKRCASTYPPQKVENMGIKEGSARIAACEMQGEMQAIILLQSNKDQNPLNPSIEPVDWWNRKKKHSENHTREKQREND